MDMTDDHHGLELLPVRDEPSRIPRKPATTPARAGVLQYLGADAEEIAAIMSGGRVVQDGVTSSSGDG